MQATLILTGLLKYGPENYFLLEGDPNHVKQAIAVADFHIFLVRKLKL